jgi:hypothetical protein
VAGERLHQSYGDWSWYFSTFYTVATNYSLNGKNGGIGNAYGLEDFSFNFKRQMVNAYLSQKRVSNFIQNDFKLMEL